MLGGDSRRGGWSRRIHLSLPLHPRLAFVSSTSTACLRIHKQHIYLLITLQIVSMK
jgi:hypothetical protein